MRPASITDVNKSSQATEQQRAATTPGAGLSQPPPLISIFLCIFHTDAAFSHPNNSIAAAASPVASDARNAP
jgi:H+/gluconate symporter-like permease